VNIEGVSHMQGLDESNLQVHAVNTVIMILFAQKTRQGLNPRAGHIFVPRQYISKSGPSQCNVESRVLLQFKHLKHRL
jgi:hypothetical protein